MSPSWNPQLQTLFQIVPNLCHLRSKSTAKSNIKLWPSLTPRLTTDGSAGYCTLSAGQGTRVQMKNTPGCQLQNSNTLKNSSRTSMPNTHRSPAPSRFDFPTPTSSDTHTPFKKTSLPIHSTPLIGSPHHLNSEFTFYMHSEHYLNITTHFRILFHIFTAYFTSLQLIRTSEAYFGNFGSISDLQSLFQKLWTYFGPPKFISETLHL
jgi:hypothetical protein